MKTAVLIILMLVVMVGCASQARVPVMPQFTTESGKECARICQGTYSQCTVACGPIASSSQRKQCLNNCNQILKDCYTTCK
jgi:uncharacterized protein YcfL